MIKDTPLISVLLCVYNPKKAQLEQAVNSIVNQTMKEWELLLYDDGSHEQQERYIYDISCMDKRIRYYRNDKHHSLAYGLNQLMQYATGKYIARMDGDDYSHPERFRRSYEFLENHPEYAWVGCNTRLMDSDGAIWGCRQMPEVPKAWDFLRYSPYIHPAVMFRADIIKYAKYKKSDRMLRGEDYELFMRLHALGKRGYNLQEELFFYREDELCYKRRSLLCQMEEVRIRWYGFKRLGFNRAIRFVYSIKPLVVWAIPNSMILRLKKLHAGREKEHENKRKTYKGIMERETGNMGCYRQGTGSVVECFYSVGVEGSLEQ